MKKVLLIISAIFIVLALAVFVCTMSACDWSFNNLIHPEKVVTYDITDSFSDVEISVSTSDVKLVATDDATPRVVSVEGNRVSYRALVEDGALKIERIDSRRWYEYISVNCVDYALTVYLPRGEWGALTLTAGTGDVEISDGISFASASITASTGDVDFESDVVGAASVVVTTGDIEIKNASCGSLSLSVSTGDIEAEGLTVLGDIKINSGTSDSELTNVKCKNLISKGSTGDLTLTSVIASEKMTVNNSTGDVILHSSDALELSIKTSTGDVKGTLLSPKIFITKVSTGKIDVPRSTEGGVCEVTTTTGNIIISLAD